MQPTEDHSEEFGAACRCLILQRGKDGDAAGSQQACVEYLYLIGLDHMGLILSSLGPDEWEQFVASKLNRRGCPALLDGH